MGIHKRMITTLLMAITNQRLKENDSVLRNLMTKTGKIGVEIIEMLVLFINQSDGRCINLPRPVEVKNVFPRVALC